VLKRLGDGASGQFGELLRAHGIGVVQAPAGGRRNNINSKTFHSIRSTCTTELHAAGGISETMAMELIGHESKDVHKVYLRPSREQLREVAAKLPEL
jgi:integrase